MKKLFLILNSTFLIFNSSFAQPAIQWQKCLGGTGDDIAFSIEQTADGGYIVAGCAYYNNGDITGNHGDRDYWVVKLDSSGNIQWQKCLGGTNYDNAYFIEQTADGGFIVAGYTNSNDGDVTGNHGGDEYWIVKLDDSGTIQWQKCLGGTFNDIVYSVQQTVDGDYVIAGYTNSNDGDVIGNHGGYDYWILKLDSSGNIQWQKCLGGTGDDWARSVQQTTDGGFIVSGETQSNDGDVSGNHGGSDYWVVKLNGSGNLQWQKCFGGTDVEVARSVQQTADGGYIVAGYTRSNDGDVAGNHSTYPDYWVVKLDGGGNLQWQKCLGGTNWDEAASIQQTTDGGYIVAGVTNSIDGDITGNHTSNGDYWVVKLDGSGTIQWQECLGGAAYDEAFSVQQTADEGYIVAGGAYSFDGDVTGHHSLRDYWIVKLSPFAGIEEEGNNFSFNISPNPFTTQTTINFESELHNATFSLYNLLGEKVAETTGISGESFQFNRGNLQSGVYIFEIIEKERKIGRGKAVIY